jgi:hypothetical protein
MQITTENNEIVELETIELSEQAYNCCKMKTLG